MTRKNGSSQVRLIYIVAIVYKQYRNICILNATVLITLMHTQRKILLYILLSFPFYTKSLRITQLYSGPGLLVLDYYLPDWISIIN